VELGLGEQLQRGELQHAARASLVAAEAFSLVLCSCAVSPSSCSLYPEWEGTRWCPPLHLLSPQAARAEPRLVGVSRRERRGWQSLAAGAGSVVTNARGVR